MCDKILYDKMMNNILHNAVEISRTMLDEFFTVYGFEDKFVTVPDYDVQFRNRLMDAGYIWVAKIRYGVLDLVNSDAWDI